MYSEDNWRESQVSVSTISVDLPAFLQEQMAAAQEAGFYSSEAELVADAVRTLLAARPDLRVATACQLYARGTVSLGRGAELAGLDVVRFKRTLHERGISRTAPESPAETTEMARTDGKKREV
jgi:predicted HTH domain antitoxin